MNNAPTFDDLPAEEQEKQIEAAIDALPKWCALSNQLVYSSRRSLHFAGP